MSKISLVILLTVSDTIPMMLVLTNLVPVCLLVPVYIPWWREAL